MTTYPPEKNGTWIRYNQTKREIEGIYDYDKLVDEIIMIVIQKNLTDNTDLIQGWDNESLHVKNNCGDYIKITRADKLCSDLLFDIHTLMR